MELLAKTTDWTTVDEERWAAFLETETGKRLLPKLAETTPALLPGGETNSILIRNGEVRAFLTVIETLLGLAHPEPPAAEHSPAYPPPEDDRYWNDGAKLNPEPNSPSSPDKTK